ncbi:MAG TPA: SUMF1/EgtB/PvdO family nonheme iron enzyme, partial [Polyangiaceae bacterium]|nr:SUMF1/EgtB/PvdO family nonheme iron enzyme [Polyangiaceae bacterium]
GFPFGDEPSDARRLVVLSPFVLDKTEVTAGAIRPWYPSHENELMPWSGKLEGADWEDYCTYAGPNDALPINCIIWGAARQYCLDRGADLPSEAQSEYAMSGLGRWAFPWGSDPAGCDDVVFARGGFGFYENFYAGCRASSSIGGALTAGHGARDRLDFAEGSALDLAGNVQELTRDHRVGSGNACWPIGLLIDPTCDSADSDVPIGVRGGSWLSSAPIPASLPSRFGAMDASPEVGFRCARPGE